MRCSTTLGSTTSKPAGIALSVLMIASTLLGPVLAQAGDDPVSPMDERVREARAVSAELAAKLKYQLEAAMKADGPVAALAICNTVAPEIANDLSRSFGGEIGRTALKVRNPNNKPDAFERGILERFIAEAAAATDMANLEYSELVEENGKRVFRYMKAIPMAEKPCAACHGKSISPAVLDNIKKIYPEDQATGFTSGEVRGAFTISKPVD